MHIEGPRCPRYCISHAASGFAANTLIDRADRRLTGGCAPLARPAVRLRFAQGWLAFVLAGLATDVWILDEVDEVIVGPATWLRLGKALAMSQAAVFTASSEFDICRKRDASITMGGRRDAQFAPR
jgi:hypothetical protein